MKIFEKYLTIFIISIFLIKNTNLLLNFENFPNDLKLEKQLVKFERQFLQLEKRFHIADIYTEFEKIFEKKYSITEKIFRQKILKENIKFIKINNRNNNSFKMGLNQFSDLDEKEFNDSMLMNDLDEIIRKKIGRKEYNNYNNRALFDFFSGNTSDFFGNKKKNKFEESQYNKNLTIKDNFFSDDFFDNSDKNPKKTSKKKTQKNAPLKTAKTSPFPKTIFFQRDPFSFKPQNPPKKSRTIKQIKKKINKKHYKISDYPKILDWSLQEKVTLIQNQGSCSLCYAFSSLAALESQLLIKNKKRHNLSEQEILECTDDYKNKGCKGGLSAFVYDYIIEKGIHSENNYMYNGEKKSCRKIYKRKNFFRNLDYVEIDNHVLALIAALQFGPVSVAHIVTKSFKYYNEGVLDENACISKRKAPNHSSLLVGYDLEAEVPFFRFKNSWGEKWGDSGYFKLKIGPLDVRNQGICLLAKYKINAIPIIL